MVRSEEELFDTLKNKKYTYIQIGQRFTHLPILEDASHIREFMSYRARLRFFPPMEAMENLRELGLSNASLKQLPSLKSLKNLRVLFVYENDLGQLAEHLQRIRYKYTFANNFPKWLNYALLIDRK